MTAPGQSITAADWARALKAAWQRRSTVAERQRNYHEKRKERLMETKNKELTNAQLVELLVRIRYSAARSVLAMQEQDLWCELISATATPPTPLKQTETL